MPPRDTVRYGLARRGPLGRSLPLKMNYIGEYVAPRVKKVPDRQRCSPTSPLAFEGHYVGHNPGGREICGATTAA